MKKMPEFLKPGDLVSIVCPAGFVPDGVVDAVALLTKWGLRVRVGDTVKSRFHQFAGEDAFRAQEFQQALNDPEVKAIFAARGGYGTVRMIDRVDFSNFLASPKWIIGFSDITVLHSHVHAISGLPTIHGQMPLTIPEGTKSSLDTLRSALFGEELTYAYKSSHAQIDGEGRGILVGGNLSLLIHVMGSVSEMDYKDKILFIEDVGEYLYAVDRMLWTLKRSGKLSGLRGLIVGGFTGLKDNDTPFGMTVAEMVLEKVQGADYPVAFDFPAGHINNNHALVLGREVSLQVQGAHVSMKYV